MLAFTLLYKGMLTCTILTFGAGSAVGFIAGCEVEASMSLGWTSAATTGSSPRSTVVGQSCSRNIALKLISYSELNLPFIDFLKYNL